MRAQEQPQITFVKTYSEKSYTIRNTNIETIYPKSNVHSLKICWAKYAMRNNNTLPPSSKALRGKEVQSEGKGATNGR